MRTASRRVAGPEHPADSRTARSPARASSTTTRVRHARRTARRRRREDRRARFVGDRSDGQPRLQPGRVRRAAGHHQPALRGVLPGEAAVLPRERRLLPDADQPVLLAPHRRPAGRRARDGKARRLGGRRAGDRRSRAGPRSSTSTIRASAIARSTGSCARGARSASRASGRSSPAATSAHRSTASPRSIRGVKLNSRIFVDGQAVVSDDRVGDGEQRATRPSRPALNRSGRKLSVQPQLLDIGTDFRSEARLRAAHRHPAGDRVRGAALAAQDRADPVVRPELVRAGDVGSRRHPPGLDGPLSVRDRVPAASRGFFVRRTEIDGAVRRASSSASTRTWSTTSRAGSSWMDFAINVRDRRAPQLLSGHRPAAVPRRISATSTRQAHVPAARPACCSTRPTSTATSPPARTPATRHHLRQPHRPLARELPGQPRALASGDPRLQRRARRTRSLVDLERTKHLTADLLMTYLVHPGHGVLRRLHRRLRQRGDRRPRACAHHPQPDDVHRRGSSSSRPAICFDSEPPPLVAALLQRVREEAWMSEAKPRGRFVWFDLMTTDPAKAVEFYTKRGRLGHDAVGGLGAVHDVDQRQRADRRGDAAAAGSRCAAALARLHLVAGRRRHRAAGRIARARRCWWRRTTCRRWAASRCSAIRRAPCSRSSRPSRRLRATRARPRVREFSWHELATREQPAAFRFYEALFGWYKTSAMDMGPMGQYQMFGRNDVELGGMFNRAARDARPAGVDALHPGRRHQSRRSRRPRPAAGRSSTARWKCPAATGSSRASTRRARCSPCTRRGRRKKLPADQLPATSYQLVLLEAGSSEAGSYRFTTPTCRSRHTPARSASGTPSPAGRSARRAALRASPSGWPAPTGARGSA